MSEFDAVRLVQIWTQIARTLDELVVAAGDNLPLHERAMDELAAEETLAAVRAARTAADAAVGAYNRLAISQQPPVSYMQPAVQQYNTGRMPAYAPHPMEQSQNPQHVQQPVTW